MKVHHVPAMQYIGNAKSSVVHRPAIQNSHPWYKFKRAKKWRDEYKIQYKNYAFKFMLCINQKNVAACWPLLINYFMSSTSKTNKIRPWRIATKFSRKFSQHFWGILGITLPTFTCLKSTMENHNNMWNLFNNKDTTARRQWRRSGIFIINFEQVSHILHLFILLTLNK